MKLNTNFRYLAPASRVHAGVGALSQLYGEAKRVGLQRAFVISSETLARTTDLADKVKDALGMSLNVPAVEMLYLAGVKNSIEMAKRLGITGLNNTGNYGLSLVLGGGEVKLLELTSAYGVFASNGIRQETVAVLKVTDTDGNVIFEHKKTF